VLAEYGASPEPANFDLYKHIVGGVLALSHAEQSREGELSCKDFLWQLVQPVLSSAQATDLPAKVRKLPSSAPPPPTKPLPHLALSHPPMSHSLA